MKTIYIVIISLVLLPANMLLADWYLQNPSPTAETLNTVEFVDANTGFIGGDGGLVLKTTDAGESWKTLDARTSNDINKILQTDMFTIAVGNAGTTKYSTDLGESWETLQAITEDDIKDIFYLDNTCAWAVFGESVARTTTGGMSWTINATTASALIRSVYFIDASTGWIAGPNFIYKSIDGGVTWVKQYTGSFELLLDICFVDANTGYAAGMSGILLKTTDAGENWSEIESFTNSTIHYLDNIDGTIWAGCGNQEIYKLQDAESGWQEMYSDDNNAVLDMDFLDDNTIWAVGKAGLILKSTDAGATWNNMAVGYGFNSQNDVVFTDANNGWTVNDEAKVFHTTDGGQNWEIINTPSIVPLKKIFFLNELTGWIVGDAGVILKTSDGGQNWSAQSSGSLENLYDVYFSDANNGVISGGSTNNLEGIILRTQSGGATWETVDNPADNNLRKMKFVDANTGWACGYKGNLLKTTDGGASWVKQTIDTENALYGIDFIDANTGWTAGGSGDVFKTTDGGTNWELEINIGDASIMDIFIWNDIPFFVGYSGLYSYIAEGQLENLSGDLPGGLDFHAIYVWDANTAWVVGSNNSIYCTNSGETGIVDETLVRKISASIFPNPVLNSATLKFNLNQPVSVNISVVDILGNTLIETGEFFDTPGEQQYIMGTGNLPEGCYFCNISYGEYMETVKMIIVR